MRIRWRGVARAAAIVVVALLGLRLLPGLLRAPEPPPLGADVGLPRARPVRGVERKAKEEGPEEQPEVSPRRRVPDAPAATAKIGTGTRRRRAPHPRRPPPEPAPEPAESTPPPAPGSLPAPTPGYVPPSAPEAAPEPVPEPAPAPRSTPGDGSEEFAPR